MYIYGIYFFVCILFIFADCFLDLKVQTKIFSSCSLLECFLFQLCYYLLCNFLKMLCQKLIILLNVKKIGLPSHWKIEVARPIHIRFCRYRLTRCIHMILLVDCTLLLINFRKSMHIEKQLFSITRLTTFTKEKLN